MSFQEGRIPFKIPTRDDPCETYYKIYGDLQSGIPPLVVLHGGPGSGHEYVEPFSKLLSEYDVPVILYDQIGCGKSTHLRDTMGDFSLWQPSLFVTELENLLTHLDISGGPGFDVLGHSWGGTLAVAFAARQPAGLRRLVIANANASGQLLKKNVWKLSRNLSVEHQNAIDEAVQKEEFEAPAYLSAMGSLMKMYLCRADPVPPELAADHKNQSEDRTVRRTMQGRSPFLYDGSLEHWSNIPLLPKINVPTLVYNCEFDTAQDSAVQPFFDHIPRVRWVTIPNASHMPHLDSAGMQQKVLQLVGDFLHPEKRYG